MSRTPPPERRPRRAVTGRAIVLGTMLVLLLVLIASPLNNYFNSRGQSAAAAQQLAQDRAELAQLKRQYALWSDPGYVQEQARRRLQYALPGDTVYVVVDHGQKSDIATTRVAARAGTTSGSWNTRLWSSIQGAGG